MRGVRSQVDPRRLAAAAILAIACTTVTPVFANPDRPMIGLVLSGGGARGAAHIGVLRELERQRVPIDYIAGTSMGAIVGGLYASGLGVDEIEAALSRIDWDNIFDDSTDRRHLSIRRKRDDDFFLVNKAAGLRDGKLEAPSGIIKGQKLYLELKKLTLHVSGIDNFDHLAIPFRCVAADIATGESVVIGDGDLGAAIRASMAVPAVFSPVERDGVLLVDGGISNNLPVDVVRAMGADVVIASDISSPLLTGPELGSVISIASQLSGLLTRKNVEMQISTLGPDDILLIPELGDFSAANFAEALTVVDAGTDAAREAAPRLSHLVLDPEHYAIYSGARQISQPALTETLAFIRIDNDTAVDDDVIRTQLGVAPGDVLDLTRLEAGIANVYGLDIFESVTYRIVREDDETGLMISAREKPWGPDYLQVGLRYATDFGESGGATLGLSHIRLPWGERGGEWRTALFLGRTRGIATEVYKPIAQGSPYFAYGSIYHTSDLYEILKDGSPIAENRVQRFGSSLALGREFGSWGEVRLGYNRYTGDIETQIGLPTAEDDDLDGGQLFARLLSDTLDKTSFPRAGFNSQVRLGWSDTRLGADESFNQALARFTSVRSIGHHTLRAGLDFLTTWDGTAPLPDQGRLGGLFSLPGFGNDRLIGENLLLLKAGYMRQLDSVTSMDTFAGLNLSLGNVFEDTNMISFTNLLWGVGAWVGLDSLAGPLYFGYGIGENANRSAYVLLGGQF